MGRVDAACSRCPTAGAGMDGHALQDQRRSRRRDPQSRQSRHRRPLRGGPTCMCRRYGRRSCRPRPILGMPRSVSFPRLSRCFRAWSSWENSPSTRVLPLLGCGQRRLRLQRCSGPRCGEKTFWPESGSTHSARCLAAARRGAPSGRSHPRAHDRAVRRRAACCFAGDAAAATDPATGEGIAQALITASLPGRALPPRTRRYAHECAALVADHSMSMALSRGCVAAVLRVARRVAGLTRGRGAIRPVLFETLPGRWRSRRCVASWFPRRGAYATLIRHARRGRLPSCVMPHRPRTRAGVSRGRTQVQRQLERRRRWRAAGGSRR